MCRSGYCAQDTWKCAEKPEGTEEPKEEPAPVAVEEEKPIVAEPDVVLSLPDSISLKRGEKASPLLGIQNKSQEEIILGSEVQVYNYMPAFVYVDDLVLQVFGKRLAPGSTINVEGDRTNMIERLTLLGKGGGDGEIEIEAVYFFGGQVKRIKKTVAISVSEEHIQKEETATALFQKETMILEEKLEVVDPVTGETKEYVFVKPEDNVSYRSTINGWQASREEVKKHLEKLTSDFRGAVEGVVKPEIVSFFETIKALEEAETPEEISEITLRTIAPSTIVASFDFVNLLDAIEEQKKDEKAFLDHFGATEFTNVPIRNEDGEIIGYSRAILKEEDGKVYAIKIGDL